MMQDKELIMSNQSQEFEDSLATEMIYRITGVWVSQAIYVAAYLRLADLLKDGEKHIEELAKSTGTKSPRLYRLLRALASIGIFIETKPRRFLLTQKAEYLRSDNAHSLRSLSMAIGDEWSWRSWGKMLNIIKNGELPLEKLYGSKNAYEYFADNPESNKIFGNAMTDFTKNTIVPAVLEIYNFSGINKLVDVGGSHGALIASVLIANPQLNGVLFDLPQVTNYSSKLLCEEGVADRCEIVSGDFFLSIPPGGDVYILSQILHGFDDDSCIRILKNVRQSIKENGRLIVIQSIIFDGNEPSFNKFLDLELMILDIGARERTEDEYRQIFQASGFHLSKISSPSGPVSLIEGICV